MRKTFRNYFTTYKRCLTPFVSFAGEVGWVGEKMQAG